MKRWVWLTISWFGISGYFRHVRGTWGTLAALPVAYAIQISLGNIALGVASLAAFAIGIIASNHYMASTGTHDPGEIVIDEVAGVFLLLAFMAPTWQCYVVAFILFRAFDILKPWPVSWADKKLAGGLGVMLDDMLAGLYPVVLFYALHVTQPELAESILAWLQIN